MINAKYFDVIIEKGEYHIVETQAKPKKYGSAISTLKKIETILDKDLKYSANFTDKYSQLTKEELLKLFKEKAADIDKGYHEKLVKLSSVSRKILGNEKKVKALHKRIESLATSNPVLAFSNEVIQKIAQNLGNAKDLASFARLNYHAKTHAHAIQFREAQQVGFAGTDEEKARIFLKEIDKEISTLCKLKVFPEEIISYKKNKKVDREKTLHNLLNLTTENIFFIFSKEEIYKNSFQKVRNLICKGKNLERSTNLEVKKKGALALSAALSAGDPKILEVLLRLGADPNVLVNRSLPLGQAASMGAKTSVKLLLKYHAKVNGQDADGSTALKHACSIHFCDSKANYLQIIKILLDSGADANIGDNQGFFPLHVAVKRRSIETVELLLSGNAHINSRTRRGWTPLHFYKSYTMRGILVSHGAHY